MSKYIFVQTNFLPVLFPGKFKDHVQLTPSQRGKLRRWLQNFPEFMFLVPPISRYINEADTLYIKELAMCVITGELRQCYQIEYILDDFKP